MKMNFVAVFAFIVMETPKRGEFKEINCFFLRILTRKEGQLCLLQLLKEILHSKHLK